MWGSGIPPIQKQLFGLLIGKNPLSDRTGVLRVKDGNLTLSDGKGKLYWSAQHEFKSRNLVAKLNDTGNLILFGDWFREILWQSFHQPTDTFLFGMKIEDNFVLTSWTSEEDPAPGNFKFMQVPDGRQQLVVMEKSTTHWKSSRRESSKIIQSDDVPSTIVNFTNFRQRNMEDFRDKRMVMNFTGLLQYWQLAEDKKSWSLVWWEPKDHCSVFNYCGNFGTCNGNSKLPCKCLPGFKPEVSDKWDAGDFSDGCSANSTP